MGRRGVAGLIVGAALGLAWMVVHPIAQAEATLFFPAPLMLGVRARATPGVLPTPGADEAPLTTVAWAEDLLTGKEAVETICKRIERLNPTEKTRLLRSAVLLGEPGRVSITDLPDSRAILVVTAEDSRSAQVLCEGLLAYLLFKTKIPLEDPEADQLHEVERRLREHERRLGRAFYSQLGFETPSQGRETVHQQDLQDYQADVSHYRPLLRRQFLRETQTAASGPYFVVLEPASPRPDRWRWIRGAGLGALAGWLASRLFKPRRRLAQEPTFAARTSKKHAANE